MQLTELNRMKVCIGKNEMETLINIFAYSNFNCCFLVWYVTSCKSTNKIEKRHQRCLRVFLNDQVNDFKTY